MTNCSKRRYGLALALIASLLLQAFRLGGPTEEERRKADFLARRAKAEAVFKERCKTAGTIVTRTVEDVEGIQLLKVRPKSTFREWRDPMWPGAAMATEYGEQSFIMSFFLHEWRDSRVPNRRGSLNYDVTSTATPGAWLPFSRGYKYVDVVDPSDGMRYRYTMRFTYDAARILWTGELSKQPTTAPSPRYAVDFEDLVGERDRAQWIGGTVIRVIVQSTGEVIAQRTSYVMDGLLGDRGGFREPWLHAGSSVLVCPRDQAGETTGQQTRQFVDTILISKRESKE